MFREVINPIIKMAMIPSATSVLRIKGPTPINLSSLEIAARTPKPINPPGKAPIPVNEIRMENVNTTPIMPYMNRHKFFARLLGNG